MRLWGKRGMPDTIRSTVESSEARPQQKAHSSLCTAHAGWMCIPALLPSGAWAGEAPSDPYVLDAYLTALALLDRHEVAALALTLGILCFAVLTAILLLRTRARLAEVESAARDESIAAKASIDRAYGLLLSERQILIAW